MTQVSFYLFEKSTERQVESACRLCRKILNQHPQIWWYCTDSEIQNELDDKLWSFDPNSFIPHGVNQSHSPVCISEHLPPSNDWIVFNFNNHALEQIQDFRHIIEIIENNETAKQLGREKFKTYRRLGIEPRTFKL
ncbi:MULTISPECIES: DNA polymerase III subunit chi [Acinetobacter]|uniref:DNA polymerase III subunit chi n=1 Tax=Acinetobacter haemolyticus TaxID=29430 RepID=A0A372MM76_ACIHA|nr:MULTISPECIES: DNA polymerase III subunit chi [Acinetobacter]EEH69910.1 putative DNA polymerase III subunit chi [Acinetobacter sp. ATCC 27244]NAR49897.1 DNA polymerase III subunit chi [Acinetobacter haemolyticus]NAR59030.1 DNA polymerase III subunit chi [Acinetobacter haemolyticus]NAR65450.1 DNA polymerase III subunit chi [Acinetobacter haemolyticus]NAR69506.1 DNA polymerase III subunit chi [Acinetobacter haemolyticus]